MTKPSEGVWVLTTEYNQYDQEGAYLCAVWPAKPTVKQLAEFFSYTSASSVVGNVMGALAFIMHLEAGGGRRGVEDQWYNLEFVKYGEKVGG